MSSLIATPATVTLLGINNQIAAVSPFANYNGGSVDIETTLNHKYTIHADQLPLTDTPRLRYFGIGVNGVGGTGANPVPYTPKATDGDLYTPIPVRVRPLDDDLSEEDAANYRMREERNVGGVDYALYWLKVIDFDTSGTTDVSFAEIAVGEPPVNIPDIHSRVEMEGMTPNTGTDVSSQVIGYIKGLCAINHTEVSEAFDILAADLGLDDTYMQISEFGIYSGIERDGVDDAVYVQLAFKRCMLGIDLTELGSTYQEEIVLENGSLALVL